MFGANVETATFLMTDIEGSTGAWERAPEAMSAALAEHDHLLQAAIAARNGRVVKTLGDGFLARFTRAEDAVLTACEVMRALNPPQRDEPDRLQLRVRAAIHSGPAEARDGDYFGPTLNRTARLLSAAHAGQILLSEDVEASLAAGCPAGLALRDLGAHRLRDLTRRQRIFQLLHPQLPAEFPPLRTLDSLAHNLPVQTTRFIGREQDAVTVKQHLRDTRMLSLCGPGGVGKTRLALQVAAEVATDYRDGVWLVELAPLRDAGYIPQAVASVLGVREEPGRALADTLAEHLRERSLLLVLDNCEHLTRECAQLVRRLLAGCPHVSVLATSREPLGVPGERLFRVQPLSLPRASDSPESILRADATQLFIDRATLREPSFRLTARTPAALARLCQRLDGIPLALEIAAAWTDTLSIDQIAARVAKLPTADETAPERQHDLAALINWSYDLLSEPERALLRRLAVFVGGWTLEAAEAVCAGDPAPEEDVFQLLGQLVRKSLVLRDEVTSADGEPTFRYRLLETVREYCRGKLASAGEAPAVHQRHCSWALELASEAEAGIQGPDQRTWLRAVESEHENLRAAMQWCSSPGGGTEAGNTAPDAEAAQRFGVALWRFWFTRGYISEGRAHLERALQLPGTVSPLVRVRAYTGAGSLTWAHGDYGTARRYYQTSLDLSRELDDQVGIASALNNLAMCVATLGEVTEARQLFEQSVAICRALGDQARLAQSLSNLAQLTCECRDLLAARSLLEESLSIFRALRQEIGESAALHNLACVLAVQDDPAAEGLFTQALRLRHQLGDRNGMISTLEQIARHRMRSGDCAAAIRLIAGADAARTALGRPLRPQERAERDEAEAAARAVLDAAEFDHHWAAGAAIPLEETAANLLAGQETA